MPDADDFPGAIAGEATLDLMAVVFGAKPASHTIAEQTERCTPRAS